MTAAAEKFDRPCVRLLVVDLPEGGGPVAECGGLAEIGGEPEPIEIVEERALVFQAAALVVVVFDA